MKLLIAGSQEEFPGAEIWLDRWARKFGAPKYVICLGHDCNLFDKRFHGSNLQGYKWALSKGYKIWVIGADWKLHGSNAFTLRTRLAVAQTEPGDWCLAFPMKRNSLVWDCIERARAAHVNVLICKPLYFSKKE